MLKSILNRLVLLLLVVAGTFTSSYAFECSDCPGDFNYSHHVDTVDLNILLDAFGTACDGCCEDMDGNGVVTSTDLTIFLSYFGTQCDIECSCPGDLNWDNVVDQDDLYDVLLPLFGTNCTGCCSDLDGNGIINTVDLTNLLSLMGTTCPDCTSCPGDFDGSGYVDQDDLNEFILLFNQPCDGCCEDMNEDGMVDILDLYLWLPFQDTNCNPEECDHCPGDFNFDLVVDDDDALIMLNAYPSTCNGCCEDMDSDGDVDQADLVLFNEAFGNECDPFCGDCLGDLDFSLEVDQADLDILLAAFGNSCDACCEDLNGDGLVNTADLTIMLGVFGTNCAGLVAEEVETRSYNSKESTSIATSVENKVTTISTDANKELQFIWLITHTNGNKEVMFGHEVKTSTDLVSAVLFEFDQKDTDNSKMSYKIFDADRVTTTKQISIYPNPSASVISVLSKDVAFNQLNSISVSDISGRLIQSYDYEITADGLQINISGFENGTYVLSLEDVNGVITTEIFQVVK